LTFIGTTYEFLNNRILLTNFEDEIKQLPYIVNDPHKLDKKVDPKKLQFRLKIDKNGSLKREEYFTVKEIISPEKIKLNNNLIVNLLA